MNCPTCSAELREYILKDINVERCPQCGGTWLDFEELDELEDSVFDKDSLKLMKKFNYRLYDLELDYCEEHHGFWLDKGEEDRIIATMKEEVKRTARGFALEDDWPSVLKNLRSKSLVSLVRALFRG